MPRSRKLAPLIALHLAVTVAGAYVGSGGTPTITPRQETPDLPATTSIDWWPYPEYQSWGAATATTPPDPAIPTVASSFLAAVSPTSDDAATTQPTSAPSPADSSPTSTGTVVHITALPPPRTPRRNFKRPNSSSFKIAYLAPVFAVLGVVVGMFLTWLVFRLSRGRLCCLRRGGTPLRAGPKYEAPPMNMASEETDPEASSGSRFLGLLRQGKKSLPESILSRGNSERPSWLQRGSSSRTHASSVLTPQRSVSHGTAERGDASTSHLEDDPFLPSPARQVDGFTSPAPMERRPTSRSALSGSSSPFGDVFSDDEDERVPYDTLRHKSIRRVILERLNPGSHYRGGHKRADSDVTVDGVNAKRGAYTPVSLHPERAPSRTSNMSGASAKSPRTAVNGVSNPGFRLVDGEPSPDPTREGGLLGLNWTLPWIASPDKLNTEDRFTAIPSRRSPMEKRVSPLSPTPGRSRASSSSSIKQSLTKDPEKIYLPRVDSSVLPTSPPRVTSPPLDAQLFFGTIPQKFGATPQLDFEFPPTTPSLAGSPSATGSPRSKGKKLHTQRTPPLLPFPSSRKYTHRLTKSKLRTTTTPKRGPSSPSTPTRTPTSEGRPAAPHGVHNKVDQILASSWSARDMRGEERVGSPNMFGAVTDANGVTKGGIEHRLLG